MKNVNLLNVFRFVLLVGLLFLFSCPTPLTEIMLSNVQDSIFPVIDVVSPTADTYCANLVEVAGRATDLSDNNKSGEISKLEYLISGTAISGDISLSEDGSFTFIFSTTSLGTNFTLVLTAVDWNGNSISEYISLRKNLENSIPSFSATSDNKSVLFSWDSVPRTESYTLYYTTNGSLPSEIMGEKIENVSSPYELENLENGSMIIAMLKANPEPEYSESVSDYVRVIPLSEFTLDVRTVPQFKQIRVEWKDIPAIDSYEIFRSSERSGIYYNLSGPISRNYYIDAEVDDDSWYYYRVRPYLEGGTESNYAAGQTDPFSSTFPLHVANIATPDWAEWVDVEGDYAYVAIKGSGLMVVDVTDPTAPVALGSVDTPGNAVAVAVRDEIAYVADSSGEMQVIDVSNPGMPSILTSLDTGLYSFSGITLSGDYALVAAGSKLIIFDIATDPENPVIVKTVDVSGNDVVVQGDYAYLGSTAGIGIVYIAPIITDSAAVHTVDTGGGNSIAVRGNYAYTATSFNKTVNIVDITDPAVPTTAGMGTITLNDSGRDVFIRGNYLYVGDNQNGGLKIYDVSDPSTPVLIGSYDTTGACSNIDVEGDYLYIADYEGGLQVLNVANPATPGNRGFLAQDSVGVDIQGDYAFMSTWNLNMTVGDVSDPLSPLPITSADTLSDTFNVDVRGKYAFVSGEWQNGLAIFDISDPEYPEKLSEMESDFWGDISDVFIAGDYAYLSAYGFGLYIVDISDPENPLVAGSCETINGQGVFVRGDYAYLADSYNGMRVIDVSNPANPFVANTCLILDEIYSVALSGDYAFIADNSGGVSSIDISDPTDPLLAILDTLDPVALNIRARDIVIRGDRAYVADSSRGLHVLDISVPSNLVHLGSLAITSGGDQLAVSGYYAYVANVSRLQVVNLYSE